MPKSITTIGMRTDMYYNEKTGKIEDPFGTVMFDRLNYEAFDDETLKTCLIVLDRKRLTIEDILEQRSSSREKSS